MYREGIDWDDISYRNAEGNNIVAKNIFDSMLRWDDQLSHSSIENIDYSDQPMFRSGRITDETLRNQ